MVERFAKRKVAMLVGIVLAGQLLAGLLVQLLVIGPQTARVADVTADMIEALSNAMADMPRSRRAAVLADLNRGDNLLVRPLANPPADGRRFPSIIEVHFMRALAGRLDRQESLDWITDPGDRLWVRLTLGREEYWVSMTPPRKRSAMFSLLTALGVAFVVASLAGLLIQRRLDRPLRRLTAAVDAYSPDHPPEPIDAGGPPEISTVAAAFNRLTQRLADHEADRALMLGGVRHDLRTPLTRLRLSLEMMRGDPELQLSAVRQVDRIEAMLGQFLDFAGSFDTEEIQIVEISPLLAQVVADSGSAGAIDLEVEAGLEVRTRPHALSRAVANLVANAVRHGAAPVRVEARRNGNGVAIAVTDRGSGMSSGQCDAMVRPFARGDVARGGEGTGLGLAITKRAVAALAGQLSFRFVPDGFQASVLLTDLKVQACPNLG